MQLQCLTREANKQAGMETWHDLTKHDSEGTKQLHSILLASSKSGI